MENPLLEQLLQTQKDFFAAGSTGMPDARLAALYCLNDTLEENRPILEAMLRSDGLSGQAIAQQLDAAASEQALWQKDLLRLLRFGWKKESGKPAPCGAVLLLGAPGAAFAQTMAALYAAIAAGNAVVLNLDRTAPGAADAIRMAVSQTFEENYITVCNEPQDDLKTLPFDRPYDVACASIENCRGRSGLRLFSRFQGENG